MKLNRHYVDRNHAFFCLQLKNKLDSWNIV